jgi:hypothetical protein
MEELFDNQRIMLAASQALFTKQGTGGQGSPPRPPAKSGPSTNSGTNGGGSSGNGGGSSGHKGNNKTGKMGNSNSNSGGNAGSSANNDGGQGGSQQLFHWWPTFNPWTGMVHAWPIPFRAPGVRILGP